ncbi:hypothetical protein SBOR_4188 [Sclerotinia borealis F-4128]|uniref:Ribosomal RNA-processing protein 14/surfeit locus protein 6 C-terminal domain-containing protein n=1 Tax=Sclerotinia borealis (strain F-4128) TaxID=1432307 RepID=W9CFD1_SCLBF|nr:hypothetical protein SBOR_4188 [Sclerotinia borealis F-4128]
MAESTLQDRLREHAEAFDGLLSLIPAKYYYAEDTTDQWKKKKQTKQEAAAARRAKLDPDSAKTAKDVMDERAKKRKLEESEDMEDGSEVEGIEKELPKQGLKKAVEKSAKKLKTDTESTKATPKSAALKGSTAKKDQNPEEEAARLEKRNQKEEQKKAKVAKKTAKQKTKKEEAAKQVVELPTEDIPASELTTKDKVADEDLSKEASTTKVPTKKSSEHEIAADEEPEQDAEIGHFEAEGLEEPESSKSSPPSSTFSAPNEDATSGGTSTSSTIPPTTTPKHITLPADPEILRSRLAARIEALRAARKASNPDGTPVRNRQELMEQRRKKEEQRRAHKKELRLQAKIDEEARREVALVSARSSPAGSLLSPLIRSPENNFAFGRVAFGDGQGLNEDLTELKSIPKKKGPQDVNSALAAAAKKQSRLEGMDTDKREGIEEKERWLIAKKRVNGEKVRDDRSLLKKTLKRKESQKKKSAKEWGERIDGVKKVGAMKQKKREENLKTRREGKGGKGKKGGKGGKPAGGATKKKSRPGFEGSFGGGGKKK